MFPIAHAIRLKKNPGRMEKEYEEQPRRRLKKYDSPKMLGSSLDNPSLSILSVPCSFTLWIPPKGRLRFRTNYRTSALASNRRLLTSATRPNVPAPLILTNRTRASVTKRGEGGLDGWISHLQIHN